MYRSILSLLALAATATAATIEIDVGEDGNLAFDPNSVTAAVGDVLEFHFYSGSGGHSVVESTFQSPCVPGSSTFFSGYIPGDDDGTTVFRVDVTSTDPIFFYCSLDHHCQAGMVGVVNPTSAESLAAYKQAAAGVSAGSAPSAPEGGTLVTIPAGSESSSSSAAVESSSSVASSHSSVASSSAGSSASVTSSSGSASSRASVASSASAASSHASSASSAASATSSHASVASSAASGASVTPSKTSSAGSASTASSTPATVTASGAGTNSETSVMLGLAVILGGMVAMLA